MYKVETDGHLGHVSTHFTHEELACRHCGVNGCTLELLDALEALREAVGRPIIINDAYRCAAHNQKVNGANDSQHLYGTAADIRVIGMTPAALIRFVVKVPEIRGIGRDSIRGYVHIDVRMNHGFEGKVLWTYQLDGTPRTLGVYASVPESFMT